MPEQPKQSLESQIQMARPKRHEVKRVPLTPEEKEFLGEIMDKAVAAEKAGKLAEALGYYTEYRYELLKIKEKREKEKVLGKEWDRNDVIEWVIKHWHMGAKNAADWVDKNFEFDELPKIKTKSDFDLAGSFTYETLPNNLYVKGSLELNGAVVKKMPKVLTVESDLIMRGAKVHILPACLKVMGDVDLVNTTIYNKQLSENIFVGGDVYINKSDTRIKEQLYKLKKQGGIIGDIVEQL